MGDRGARVLRRRAVAAGLAALALAGEAEAATETVRSGSIRARIGSDPWRIAIEGSDGAAVLTESGLAGAERPGSLGFETGLGWAHALRARSLRRDGEAVTATLETTDPGGGTIAVRISPARGGVIAISAQASAGSEVRATGIGFESEPGERYFGFGERSNAVEMSRPRRRELHLRRRRARRGPQPTRSRSCRRGPSSDRDDATYYPVPWMLSSSRGYGVLIDNDERSCFRPRTEDRGEWSLDGRRRRDSPPLLRRPDPRRGAAPLHRRHRAPAEAASAVDLRPLVPDRAAEPIPLENEAEWTGILREADAPVSAAETQMHYLPCGAHRDAERYLAERNAFFHSAGLAHLAYLNPKVCVSYDPGVRRRRRRPASSSSVRRDRAPFTSIPALRRRRRTGRLHRRAALAGRLHGARRRARSTRGWCDEAYGRRARRLDGGLRRVHAAGLALRRRHARREMHNRYPTDLPLRRRSGSPRGSSVR